MRSYAMFNYVITVTRSLIRNMYPFDAIPLSTLRSRVAAAAVCVCILVYLIFGRNSQLLQVSLHYNAS